MDANDVLMGGGNAKSVTFDQQGTLVGGRIVVTPKSYQVREYDPITPGGGAPKFFPSGDPIMGIQVDVQTNERTDSEDSGVRRMYLEKKRQLDAVRDAVRSVGAPGLAVGGELYVSWTGYAQDGKNPTNPPKTFQATYRPPVVAVPGTAPTTAPTTASAPPIPAQQPPALAATTTPAAPNALAGLTPEQLQALAALAPQPAAQAAPPF